MKGWEYLLHDVCMLLTKQSPNCTMETGPTSNNKKYNNIIKNLNIIIMTDSRHADHVEGQE